jgi:hypothetical protein
MTSSTEFPALEQFFGAYFHQDWDNEFESFQDAVSAYRTGEPQETLWTARKELVELMQKDLDEGSFADAIHRLGCYYDPASEGMTYRDWISLLGHALS